MDKTRGIPIVLSSPSGGGKTSIYVKLEQRHTEFFYSVSATTRPRRANEENGVQYHFLDEAEFMRRRDAGDFLETARVHGHWYGTPRGPLEQALGKGMDAVLDVDVQGGDSIRHIYGAEALLIFIVPPDLATLRERLVHRRSEEPALVERRMANALNELRRAPGYDYIVVNDELQRAVDEVEAVITAEHLRSVRLAGILEERFPELGDG